MPMHAHSEAQLTFVMAGTVQVHTKEGRWLVPPQLAVWLPPELDHEIEVLTDAELWMIHWPPSLTSEWAPPTMPDRAFALRVTPLLHSLRTAAFSVETGPEKAELVVRLMLHELSETADAPTFLPMPTSAVGLRVVDVALRDHENRLSVEEVASRSGTSVRSLSRLFPAETGLTFKAWRQRARIVRAMDELARGKPIGWVSTILGFASTAAFSAAFRQVTAMTPTTFIDLPSTTA